MMRACTYAVVALACVALATAPAGAQSAPPSASASPAATASPAPGGIDCSLVGIDEISQIVGYPVAAADDASRGSGICFFSGRSMSRDGSASYAVVDDSRLQQRRAYYTMLARRCGNIAATSPRAAVCKSFVELAQAKNVDDYFASRTDFPNTDAVKGLGDAAVAAGDALYVKRGAAVYEVVVRRGDALDVDRATALAKVLLARYPSVAEPEPSASPRRPTDS